MAKDKQKPIEQPTETVADLKQDERNYRKHSDTNKKRIKKSIDECGLGRSVVIDADGILVAGNGVSQCLPEDTPIRVIETDGSELVVVKRTDLHYDDERRKKLALADNATSDNVEWDFEAIEADEWSPEALADWGVQRTNTDRLSELNFESIYYEPQKRPHLRLQDCIDTSMYDKKIEAIEQANIPDEMKDVMRKFTQRFLRIDFQAVADYYYFNASDDEKQIIERLRLVLCDNGVQGGGFVEDDMLRIHESINGWGGAITK